MGAGPSHDHAVTKPSAAGSTPTRSTATADASAATSPPTRRGGSRRRGPAVPVRVRRARGRGSDESERRRCGRQLRGGHRCGRLDLEEGGAVQVRPPERQRVHLPRVVRDDHDQVAQRRTPWQQMRLICVGGAVQRLAGQRHRANARPRALRGGRGVEDHLGAEPVVGFRDRHPDTVDQPRAASSRSPLGRPARAGPALDRPPIPCRSSRRATDRSDRGTLGHERAIGSRRGVVGQVELVVRMAEQVAVIAVVLHRPAVQHRPSSSGAGVKLTTASVTGSMRASQAPSGAAPSVAPLPAALPTSA